MKKIVSVTCMIVVVCCVFLSGCSRYEEIQQPTTKNTEKYEEIQQSTKQNTERYEEMETSELTKSFYQIYAESIADIKIEVLKEVAYDYYNELTFIDKIDDIRICKIESEIKAHIGEDYVLGEAVVLEIDAITNGMSDRRFMTLYKYNNGEWKVYNEGR